MTQTDLETKSGVSRSTITNIENGRSIELDNLIRLALSLEIDPDILFLPPDKLADYKAQSRIFWDTFKDQIGSKGKS